MLTCEDKKGGDYSELRGRGVDPNPFHRVFLLHSEKAHFQKTNAIQKLCSEETSLAKFELCLLHKADVSVYSQQLLWKL